ncbi:winged helix-turn-helix transcriptional regulator [Pseudoduganella sp. SL102]|uniref:winged helix-turn-helix transcriptional regulator n=1 Tax=Pseudoduganella sp. SL102 TaxID=2995154 RepID=UPI00248CE594|nr:winged helix-turn-helix transcriptional regulator [Pseudoduganella sp. SL102]WBS01101.1 winged helix-turn-helix transcriptional regulator [Pseudoduganella sp. SL102]
MSFFLFPEVPPRVEYELTPMGASMLPALEGFTSWIRDHWPSIREARASYGALHDAPGSSGNGQTTEVQASQ